MADVTKEQVVDFLSNLSVIDIAALTKELEDKWGVKAAPVAVAAARRPAAARCGSGGRADGVHRHPHRRRRQQDRRHQGGPRGHRPRPQGGQGPGRGAPKAVKEGVTKADAETSRRSSTEAGAKVEIK